MSLLNDNRIVNLTGSIAAGLCGILITGMSIAADAEQDDWLEPQWEKKVAQVNEGEWVFIEEPVAQAAHHHINQIIISPYSLESGWVSLRQCHHNLDAEWREIPRRALRLLGMTSCFF